MQNSMLVFGMRWPRHSVYRESEYVSHSVLSSSFDLSWEVSLTLSPLTGDRFRLTPSLGTERFLPGHSPHSGRFLSPINKLNK